MIITISGMPGSGKTSAAKLIAERLGMPFYSVGGLRGKMALDRGITIDELNKLGESDRSTDALADDYQRELGAKEDHFVIEGRLSWYFIPHSIKIFLTCDSAEAAHRIFLARRQASEGRGDEPLYATEADAAAQISQRIASDVRRYQTHYGLDYQDPSHYDLVIDTTHFQNATETAEAILAAIKTLPHSPSAAS